MTHSEPGPRPALHPEPGPQPAPHPVPVSWAPVLPSPGTRYTTQPPLGGDMSRIGAVELAEFGAQLNAMGADAEKGAVAAIYQSFQAASIQVWMQHMPGFLSKIREWNRVRLARLYQNIERLPEAAPPQGLLSRIAGAPTQVVSLVDRQSVLREIAKLMEENPVSH